LEKSTSNIVLPGKKNVKRFIALPQGNRIWNKFCGGTKIRRSRQKDPHHTRLHPQHQRLSGNAEGVLGIYAD
jgi:hypothetical protein